MILSPSALPRKLMHDLRASYWFLPATMALAALLAAVGTETVDRNGWSDWIPHLFYTRDVDAARSVLAVIATSAIGAAGVMFSMTILAVSFASTNFGPRLIRNFMQDRGVQISLGTLLSTFVFALTILRGIRSTEEGYAFVPALSLTVALGLTMVSIMVLIFFVHHIPELISLENVTANLGRDLMCAIDKLPPSDFGPWTAPEIVGTHEPICLDTTGYLQAVNSGALRRLEARGSWTFHQLLWPGDFVAPHKPVAHIAVPTPLSQSEIAQIRDCFAVGTGRTEAQNPLFIAKQLTEIIARALSAGVNDPFTAMTCLNWLHAALHKLAQQGPVDSDPDGHGSPPLGFLMVLDTAHRLPRPYIASDPAVTLHALGLLADLEDALPEGPRRSAVRQEIKHLKLEARARSGDTPEIAGLLED